MDSDSDSDDDYEIAARRRKYLLLALLLKRKQRFRSKLDEDGRKRRDRNIPRAALNSPQTSAWQTLYNSGDDGALITVTGFDHNTFKDLLQTFSPLFYGHTPWIGKADGFKFKKVSLVHRWPY